MKYLQTMVECLCILGKVAAAGAIIWFVFRLICFLLSISGMINKHYLADMHSDIVLISWGSTPYNVIIDHDNFILLAFFDCSLLITAN